MKAFRVLILAMAVVLPLTLLTWAQRSRAQDDGGRPVSLQGSWIVTATPNAIFLCGGPQIAPPPPPFFELATYDPGGGLTETNTILNANSATLLPGLPFNGSDGHGAWEAAGPQFKAKFRKFVFDTAGVYVANADINETVAVYESNANSFTGTFSIKFTFLNGAAPSVCSSGELAAKRIAAD